MKFELAVTLPPIRKQTEMSSSSNKKLRNRSNKSQHSASNLWNVLSENQTEVNTESALDQSTPVQSPPQTLREALSGIQCQDGVIQNVTVVIGQAFTEGWSYWCGDESMGIQLKIDPEIDDPEIDDPEIDDPAEFQAGTIVTFRKLKYRAATCTKNQREIGHHLLFDAECKYRKRDLKEQSTTNLPWQCLQSCGFVILNQNGDKILGVKSPGSHHFIDFIYALTVVSYTTVSILKDKISRLAKKDKLQKNKFLNERWADGRWENCWKQWVKEDWDCIALFKQTDDLTQRERMGRYGLCVLAGANKFFTLPNHIATFVLDHLRNKRPTTDNPLNQGIKHGLPKGYQKLIETPWETAIRELEEETGISLERKEANGEPFKLFVNNHMYHQIFPYRCTSKGEENKLLENFTESGEVASIGWVAVDAIKDQFSSQYAEQLSELVHSFINEETHETGTDTPSS